MEQSRRNFMRAGMVGGAGVALGAAAIAQETNSAGALSGRCDFESWPEHGLYDATIVYGIDEIDPSGNAIYPMDSDRDTIEYRTGAYDFLRSQYGMDFDPTVVGDQTISDGSGGVALVSAVKTGQGSTHQVHALDVQTVTQWRGKFPVTNVAFLDDGYFVFILSDFVAGGAYGGAAGKRIRTGDVVVQGEYRMFNHQNRLLDTIRYFADTPATVNPFNGDAAASDGATFISITCRVESPIMGTGSTRGLGEQRPLPDGGVLLDFRYVMHFPHRLVDAAATRPRCDVVPPRRRPR